MKNICIAGILLAGLVAVFSACQNDAPKPAETAAAHDHADGNHAHIYVCPMHPEVKNDQPGTCPKCKMDLEERHAEAMPNEFEMRFAAPASAVAGQETTLVFMPRIKGKEGVSVPLDVQHEKKIHLIVVSDDLATFQHIHPEFQPDGKYLVKTTFQNGGKYTLFADYKPTGADAQLEKINLEVAGKTVPTKKWAAAKTTSTTTPGGYSVSLESEIGKFVSEGETHILVKISKNGKEIMASGLENYLAAKGHCVIISTDGEKRYLHVHPGLEKDRLHLAATFGKPGIYRGWLQFQHEGKIQTADFVLNVVDGMGETPADEHSHEGHSH